MTQAVQANAAIRAAFLKVQADKSHAIHTIPIHDGDKLSQKEVDTLFADQTPFLLTNVSEATKVLLGKKIGGNTKGKADYLIVKPIVLADKRVKYHTIESANQLPVKASEANAMQGQEMNIKPQEVNALPLSNEVVLNAFASTSVRVWETVADDTELPAGEPLPWSHTYSYAFSPSASPGDNWTPPTDGTLYGDVTYEFQILINQSQESSFQYIVGTVTGVWNADMLNNTDKEKGWGTAYYDTILNQPEGFFDYSSSPENTNNSSEVSTSVGLEVGYQSASFNYSKSTTETLTDWAVVQNSANNWTYYMATPYDGRTTSYPKDASHGSEGKLYDWPDLTTATNEWQTISTWKNNTLVIGTVDIDATFHVKANYMRSNSLEYAWWWACGHSWSPSFQINLTNDSVS
ncbi:MAG: hypothetical protein R3E32_14785 [Chitinophagales bacterium]